jgi:hypothetical protein
MAKLDYAVREFEKEMWHGQIKDELDEGWTAQQIMFSPDPIPKVREAFGIPEDVVKMSEKY